MARKRLRRIQARPGELRMAWGVVGYDPQCPELISAWAVPSQKCDATLLLDVFNHAKGPGYENGLVRELEARGYDLTTLTFSVRRKESSDETD